MPVDYRKYPKNWKSEIRPRILKREGEVIVDGKVKTQACCKFCKIENKAVVYKDTEPFEYTENYLAYIAKETNFLMTGSIHKDIYRIVLTIAHLDHDETNHDVKDDRLAALCQRCHLRYDAKEKARRRREKKYSKSLFPIN